MGVYFCHFIDLPAYIGIGLTNPEFNWLSYFLT